MPTKKNSPRRNRAARRHARADGTKPKRRALPWWIIAIALSIIGVGTVSFMNHQLSGPDLKSTPTPGPSTGATSLQLVDGSTLGALTLPAALQSGGHGTPVDGIACAGEEYMTVHVHAHLALFVDGKQIAIPSQIGIPAVNGKPACIYWLHTHDGSGIIHIEAPVAATFMLGQVFDIWGEPLERSRVASYRGPVRAYVNGARYDGAFRNIPLSAHQEITLEVGTPDVAPPHYLFPGSE